MMNSLTNCTVCSKILRRFLGTSTARWTVFDTRVFREPIVDPKELEKPLDPEDDRNFLFIKPMKSGQSPVFYRDPLVDKMISIFTRSGRKELARKAFLDAFEIIKRQQFSLWLKADEEERKSIELNPFHITRKAMRNCRPLMKLCPVTRGGVTYQVPFPITDNEAEFRAIQAMRKIVKLKCQRGAANYEEFLAKELLDAYNNEGFTVQAKQELHKQCEANRAYAHYRM